ncbi:MAG: redox-regulated ATPase YchF [Alphaproteobacteria bacterium]|nr:redox-regulated ATPase YchF [Alphaproteobacteria bacterium]
MGFNCGIVGLPNVGKSTLFNALTATAAAEAANYPFCTIEPNIGKVAVPDQRLDKIASIANSAKIIATQLEFVDIAGLVRGASQGEGLGNQFLANIRNVDAICHVLRCFTGEVTHVEGHVDPLRDAEIVETELMLADLESLEKRIDNLSKKAKSGDKDSKSLLEVIEIVLEKLRNGQPARYVSLDGEQRPIFDQLQLLTSKPVLYICNVNEEDLLKGNNFTNQVAQRAKEQKAGCVMISASIEAEIANLGNQEDKKDFLLSLGLEESGLSRVIKAGYDLLNLITFFTVGPKEAHAWTIKKGTKAPQAAGVIHSDFEHGFIRAETIACQDFIQFNGEVAAKEAGKMRSEGKEYIVSDGDIMHFRFNV